MHILIISAGFILWYFAYEAKPIVNDELEFLWEERLMSKRNRLINILKKGN